MRSLYAAEYRNKFYGLERFRPLSSYFKEGQVDWRVFERLYQTEFFKTSFKEDHIYNFRIKLLMNELPTMEVCKRRKIGRAHV